LKGATHVNILSDAMCEQGGAPGHVSIDGAAAWNGVRKQVELIYGDTDEVSFIAT
jgi:hypothetical protein